MVNQFSSAQMGVFSKRTAEVQLDRAAHDLFRRAKGDFALEHIREVLEQVAKDCKPLKIGRIKYLKILALWTLYPKAAPHNDALNDILAQDTDQDSRMQAALALPIPESGTA